MTSELEEARREIEAKSRSQIEEETAWKWAARAVAAYQNAHRLGGRNIANRLLRDATDYYHEAIEHAALADHDGDVLRTVRQWIHRYVPRGEI